MLSVSDPDPRPSELQRLYSEGGFAHNDAHSGVISHEKREADYLRLPGGGSGVCMCVWECITLVSQGSWLFSFHLISHTY